MSDGLIADAGHIARASDVAIELDLARVPLSPAGRDYIAQSTDRAQARLTLATGGDDYELVLTLAADDAPAMIAEAARRGLALTVIGQVVQGQGVRVVLEGREIPVIEPGYRHS